MTQTSNMCSEHVEWTPPPRPAISDYPWRPSTEEKARPIWVLLEVVCRHDSSLARTVIDGLDMTGRAKGMLIEWRRSGRGDWLGLVNYEVHYIDGRQRTVWFREQLLPAYALQPRVTA